MTSEPASHADEAPVCPRHPDKVSYARCQRCGRPACGECQVSASVGFQCVDCVREAKRSRPQQQSVYGGAVTTGKPVVTITIMVLCGIFFALQFLVPGFTRALVFAPLYVMDVPGYMSYPFEPWRMLTSAFLHSPGFLLHIAFNLYALWLFGQVLEPLLGRVRFLALYLVSAIGGSVAVLLLSAPNQSVLGASGAVFGLFGAFFIVQRQRGGEVRSIVVLIAINAVIGFIYPNISWQGHLGGLIAGAACAVVLAYAPRGKNRAFIQFGGMGLVFVLLVLVTWLAAALA
ncbi:rhomboid family intramembrane serine protease [Arthrobacter roseus]|uniref:rhomboid family intramembrane serine protease n=1 Tax=Arthrobacter roseus TaxID=136274 RepID=UPI0019644D57|nr:rhomboid family intramembrane serine protease [Arthrobacter roseus]MBM7847166.1 membrane associated rhomboid family serine protease [Arthrobacter roseus]